MRQLDYKSGRCLPSTLSLFLHFASAVFMEAVVLFAYACGFLLLIALLPLTTFFCAKFFQSKNGGVKRSAHQNNNNQAKRGIGDLENGQMTSGTNVSKLQHTRPIGVDTALEQETQRLSDAEELTKLDKKRTKEKRKRLPLPKPPAKTYATPAEAMLAAGISKRKILSLSAAKPQKKPNTPLVAQKDVQHAPQQALPHPLLQPAAGGALESLQPPQQQQSEGRPDAPPPSSSATSGGGASQQQQTAQPKERRKDGSTVEEAPVAEAEKAVAPALKKSPLVESSSSSKNKKAPIHLLSPPAFTSLKTIELKSPRRGVAGAPNSSRTTTEQSSKAADNSNKKTDEVKSTFEQQLSLPP